MKSQDDEVIFDDLGGSIFIHIKKTLIVMRRVCHCKVLCLPQFVRACNSMYSARFPRQSKTESHVWMGHQIGTSDHHYLQCRGEDNFMSRSIVFEQVAWKFLMKYMQRFTRSMMNLKNPNDIQMIVRTLVSRSLSQSTKDHLNILEHCHKDLLS